MCGGGGGGGGATAAEVDASVASGVTSVNANTDAGFADAKVYGQGQFDALGQQVSGVQGTVDGLGGRIDSVGSNVTGGFNNLNTYLADQFGKTQDQQIQGFMGTGKMIQEVDSRNQASFGQLGDTLRAVDTGVTEGFKDQTTRFDTLDQSVGGVQDTANRIETDVGSVQTAVDNGFIDTQRDIGGVQTDLDTLSKDTTDAFNKAATERLKNVGTVTDNQSAISGDLATISGNQDLYYEDVSDTVNNIETEQGSFRTAFDDLADKYGTDTETTTETIGRIETGLGEFAEEIRGGLGAVEENTEEDRTTLDDVAGKIDDLEGTVEGGFSTAEGSIAEARGDITSGFADQAAAFGKSSGTLLDAIQASGDNSGVTELLTTLGTNIGNLSATFLTEFGGLASAFTDTGDLIKNEVAENGDIIERTLDEQGNVIENRFNAQGDLINTSTTNINDAIAAAQAELGAGQQGLMTEMNAAQQTQFDNMAVQIAEGFDNQTGQMNTQVSDIAALASQMTELDMGMRQEFYQMGGAFDDTGALIRQEVTENGETIRRNIDQNGNLLIEKFDQTGQALGTKVFNINEALAQLAGLGTLPGASVSMGNLSPALQAQPNGKTNVPTGGFMAPYSVTV